MIGDGRTPSGELQTFIVPDDATRLYLGFADGFRFGGFPSTYGDDHGALSVTAAIETTAVPLPAANWLLLSGLAAAACVRGVRRRINPAATLTAAAILSAA
jgi:hypothetical protein